MGLAAGLAAAATGLALAGEAAGSGFQLREKSASALRRAFAARRYRSRIPTSCQQSGRNDEPLRKSGLERSQHCHRVGGLFRDGACRSK
jgi:hypothetical protein